MNSVHGFFSQIKSKAETSNQNFVKTEVLNPLWKYKIRNFF